MSMEGPILKFVLGWGRGESIFFEPLSPLQLFEREGRDDAPSTCLPGNAFYTSSRGGEGDSISILLYLPSTLYFHNLEGGGGARA